MSTAAATKSQETTIKISKRKKKSKWKMKKEENIKLSCHKEAKLKRCEAVGRINVRNQHNVMETIFMTTNGDNGASSYGTVTGTG